MDTGRRYEPSPKVFGVIYIFWTIFLIGLGYAYFERYALLPGSENGFIGWSFLAMMVARWLPDYYLHIRGRDFGFSKASVTLALSGYLFFSICAAAFPTLFFSAASIAYLYPDSVVSFDWSAVRFILGLISGAVFGIGLYLSGEAIAMLEKKMILEKKQIPDLSEAA